MLNKLSNCVVLALEMSKVEYLSREGLRIDGRRAAEIRKISARIGDFESASGSAYIEHGNTKVICCVYGPHDVSTRSHAIHDRVNINCEFSMATFSTMERKTRPKGDRKSVEMGLLLSRTFGAAIMTNLYPRAQIDIFVQVLQSDGGVLHAAINAATLALIDAGIAMKDFVTACSVGWIDNTPILDMNYTETGANGPDLLVALLPKSNKTVLLQMESRVHMDNFDALAAAAQEGCRAIYETLHKVVTDRTETMRLTAGL